MHCLNWFKFKVKSIGIKGVDHSIRQDHCPFLKIRSFSERSYPKANRIFLLVSIRQLIPFSILSTVNEEIPAILASSALLIRSFSLIFLTVLCSKPLSSFILLMKAVLHYFLLSLLTPGKGGPFRTRKPFYPKGLMVAARLPLVKIYSAPIVK